MVSDRVSGATLSVSARCSLQTHGLSFPLHTFIFPPNYLRLWNAEQGLTQEIALIITTLYLSSKVLWWEVLCWSLVLIDTGFPHVSVWEFIRVKKHSVNSPHSKLPPSSTLTGCRQLEQESLAELNRGSGLAIYFQSRVAQSSRNIRRVKPARKVCCRKVAGTWHGVGAAFLWSGSPGRCIQRHLHMPGCLA